MKASSPGFHNHFLLLFFGGLTGGCAWLVHPVFAALMWLPLLWVEKDYRENNSPRHVGRFRYYTALFRRLYVFFFTWNTMAAFWLFAGDKISGGFALLAIPLLMTIPVLLFHELSLQTSIRYNYLIFIICWLAYEFLQHHWDLAWVWLTLGNSLAPVHYLVQWYEYTGVLGGSLWVLGASVLLFQCWQQAESRVLFGVALGIWLLLPACFSLYLYFSHVEKGKATEIVVVQPDLDPDTEKKINHPDYIPIYKQNHRLTALTKSEISPDTDLVLFPESSTSSFLNVEELKSNGDWPLDFTQLIDSLKEFSNTNLLVGYNTYSIVNESKREDPGVIQSKGTQEYYLHFNSAVFYQADTINQIYHKSILVPGGERVPFLPFFKTIFFFYDFKGMTSAQEERTAFRRTGDMVFAPLICYESTFGEYVGGYIQKGATLLCVMTNDAYWQGTPEPKQHLLIDRLRAIEYRRSMARASHHGHSGFINQRGDFLLFAPTQVQVAMKSKIKANASLTFYARHGDVLGRLATALSGLFVAVLVLIRFFDNKNQHQ